MRERVVAVQRHEDHAVEVARAGEALEPLPLRVAVHDAEHELHVVLGHGGVRAAQHEREVRVGEEPLLRLGHDERHRAAAAGHQRPGRPVGDVAELVRGPQHRIAGALADRRRARQHPARRRPGDPGHRRHRLQGRGGPSIRHAPMMPATAPSACMIAVGGTSGWTRRTPCPQTAIMGLTAAAGG